MKRVILAVSAMLVLASCANMEVQPRFENMTELELATYNHDLPEMDQVYCFHETRTGSRIPVKFCRTLAQLTSGQFEAPIKAFTGYSRNQ